MPGMPFRPETLDFLHAANTRISFTHDIRTGPLADASRQKGAADFEALFGDRGNKLMGREIVNWNLAERRNPACLPDAQTTLHIIYLYNKAGDETDKGFQMNLCNTTDTLPYIANRDSFLYGFLKGREFDGISVHIGYSAANVQRLDYTIGYTGMTNHIQVPAANEEILSETLTMSRMVQSLECFQSQIRSTGFKGFIAAENNNFETGPDDNGACAYDHITSPEFIGRLADTASLDLLLDISHLMVACGNKWKIDPADYAAKILEGRQDRLKEVHLCVPSVQQIHGREQFTDSHFPFYNTLDSDITRKSLEILFNIVRDRSAGRPLILNFESATDTAYLDAVAVCTYLQEMSLAI